NVITKYLPGVQATAEATNGAVDNVKLVGSGRSELSLMMADVGYDGLMGRGAFKTKMPIQNLATLHYNYNYAVCLEGKGINSIRDLKGKRVSTSTPGSGAEVVALRVLDAYGLDPNKDIKRERISMPESSGALKDGKIDAFFWNGGLAAAAITDLAASPGIKMKLIDQGDIVETVVRKYGPIYFKTSIPAKSYPGVNYDSYTLGVSNLLICNPGMEESLAYGIVKTLFDHKEDLALGHAVGKEVKLENAVLNSPLPYHPGAIKYYTEKGLKIVEASYAK
ncbi:MAG TPA: TAXI family TRAP transporter solute-binding subunit, partial [Thermodesulfobacteriota bacterium]|nr:TAXI family TRAP transporter solute-binding subunit [Thermodesulfobacteriota bacterium]